ncbi:hypothetical protein [Streptomyces sp. NPDC001292]|uniref:hypothetical protein n=1 Tax=Streptomyces sp. NPDC001292 TaxID=3364558 RepID=UPI0036AE5FE3
MCDLTCPVPPGRRIVLGPVRLDGEERGDDEGRFGLLLVVAYGVGLALTLTVAGFAVVRPGSGVSRLLDRRTRWTAGPAAAWYAGPRRSRRRAWSSLWEPD